MSNDSAGGGTTPGVNLAAQTTSGLKWSYASTIINAVLQIGLGAVMARLLEPAAFGLIAMSGLVLRFGSQFSQMGIGSAIVQKETLSREETHAAFILSTGLGLLFTAVAWILAPLARFVFDQKDLVPVVRLMGLSFLLTGLSSPALNILRRQMRFRAIAITETASYVVGYGMVGVGMALLGYGVWSLIWAGLAQAIAGAIILNMVVRHGVSFRLSRDHFRPLLSFGSRVSVVGFLEFIGSNLDTLAIGRILGAGALGIYNRASMLASLPAYRVSSSLTRVLFPALSRLQHDRERLSRAYQSIIVVTGALIIPLCVGLAVAALEVTSVLLGEGWSAAVPVLSIISISVAVDLITHFGAVLAESQGAVNQKIKIQSLFLVVLLLLFLVFSGNGAVGFASALLLANVLRWGAYASVLRSLLDVSIMGIIRPLQPGLQYGSAVGIAVTTVSWIMRQAGLSALAVLLTQGLIGGVALLVLVAFGPSAQVRNELSSRVRFVADLARWKSRFRTSTSVVHE